MHNVTAWRIQGDFFNLKLSYISKNKYSAKKWPESKFNHVVGEILCYFFIADSGSTVKSTYDLSETFFFICDRWRWIEKNWIFSLTENLCIRFCITLAIKIPRFMYMLETRRQKSLLMLQISNNLEIVTCRNVNGCRTNCF